jgi:hypothetical protein
VVGRDRRWRTGPKVQVEHGRRPPADWPPPWNDGAVTQESTLAEVHLIGVPLRIRARSTEHEQDLLRELALVQVSAGSDGTSGAPGRLLRIADELRTSYGSAGVRPNAEMEAALDRGEKALDVVYTVPREVRPVLRRAAAILEEAEQYCRDGQYLLTLASPPDVAAYRQWVFEEFDRQLAGEAPVPWPESPYARTVSDG